MRLLKYINSAYGRLFLTNFPQAPRCHRGGIPNPRRGAIHNLAPSAYNPQSDPDQIFLSWGCWGSEFRVVQNNFLPELFKDSTWSLRYPVSFQLLVFYKISNTRSHDIIILPLQFKSSLTNMCYFNM